MCTIPTHIEYSHCSCCCIGGGARKLVRVPVYRFHFWLFVASWSTYADASTSCWMPEAVLLFCIVRACWLRCSIAPNPRSPPVSPSRSSTGAASSVSGSLVRLQTFLLRYPYPASERSTITTVRHNSDDDDDHLSKELNFALTYRAPKSCESGSPGSRGGSGAQHISLLQVG